jgi:RNA polymerase sigma-70 factor, ECF subfamily
MRENELIAAARLGDQDAFTELYRQNIGYVKAIGRHVLRNKDLDDLCQDTFLLAFTRLDSFEETSQFRTWISRIALNQCLVTLRKSRQASNGESHLVQIDTKLTAGDSLDRHIFSIADSNLAGVPARLDMDRLLRGVKPFQRQVLEMAYVEEIPGEEIAELLGTTLAMVKITLFKAKRKLRDISQ